MEIERTWLVSDWPVCYFPVVEEYSMRQGYLVVRPTVRIREEALKGSGTSYVLCLKSGQGLSRQEIEVSISREHFEEIAQMIAAPLIPKTRKSYQLPGGLKLEVNLVDEGQPTQFMYAEIEFPTVEEAEHFDPAAFGLAKYLDRDVTEDPGQTMGAYWQATRWKAPL